MSKETQIPSAENDHEVQNPATLDGKSYNT